jgi:hypothetical protein
MRSGRLWKSRANCEIGAIGRRECAREKIGSAPEMDAHSPLRGFLEVLILNDFKSLFPEVLILRDFKSFAPEVLILEGLKSFVSRKIQEL